MPVAICQTYRAMLDRARAGRFALPSVNVTSLTTANAVKMNVDTDMQYAFTRAVAGPMFKNYDGVLTVDGEVGNKRVCDPRSYLALAEAAMAERVRQAAGDLRGAGKTMFAS